MRTLLWLVALAILSPSALLAETSRDAAARLGVDVVQLKGGREVRGSLVQHREGAGLTIAVRRAWLAKRYADWLAELDAAAQTEQRAALESVIERTRKWLEGHPDDARLKAVVQPELERLEKQQKADKPAPAEQAESEFVLIRVPDDQVKRVYAQPDERKRPALVAWHEQIDNVETQPVDRLQKTLAAKKIDWRTASVDLSDRLPMTAADSEREWAARTAIFEYSYCQPLEFQGTGDFVVRTGKDAAAPGALELLGGLMQGGGLEGDLSGLLQGVLGQAGKPQQRRTWLDSASATAETEQVRGFRVTRTQQDVLSKTVTVENRFVARMPDGEWESVWINARTVDASQERKDAEARIRQDPQLGEVLKTVEGLGLGNQMQTAIRFGAATMEAQQGADTQFFEFIDRYHQRLDGPVLKWTSNQ
ncbi:MAG: hypothetical protein U0992_20470 [Planctomycetaceae bacterium]